MNIFMFIDDNVFTKMEKHLIKHKNFEEKAILKYV